MSEELSHFNQRGEAQMVDISAKASTRRVAVVSGKITMQPATLDLLERGEHKKRVMCSASLEWRELWLQNVRQISFRSVIRY